VASEEGAAPAFPENREIIREMLQISGHFGAFRRVPVLLCAAISVCCGRFPVLHRTGNFLFQNREFFAGTGICLLPLVSRCQSIEAESSNSH